MFNDRNISFEYSPDLQKRVRMWSESTCLRANGKTIKLDKRRKHAIVHLMIVHLYSMNSYYVHALRHALSTGIRAEKRQSVPSNVRCSRYSRFQACDSDVIAFRKRKKKHRWSWGFSIEERLDSSGGSTLGRGVASFRFPVDRVDREWVVALLFRRQIS